MNVYNLLIVIAAWLVSMASAVTSLILALVNPVRRFAFSLVLAGAAMMIGYLGLGWWTPFRFFPQIGYTWMSDAFEVSLSSSWFFFAPLVLGTVALVLTLANRKRTGHACYLLL